MSKEQISRRQFFRITATGGAVVAAAGVALATGCGGKGGGGGEAALSCDDVSKLPLADKQARKTNKYVEKSTHKDQNCSNCQLYKPAKGGKGCGGCTVLKGTINPAGHCNLWAKKTA